MKDNHNEDCCCQFNPDDDTYQENIGVSNCCIIHNNCPIECQSMELCECRKLEQ